MDTTPFSIQAPQLLTGKKHLAIIGSPDCEEHRYFFEMLGLMLPADHIAAAGVCATHRPGLPMPIAVDGACGRADQHPHYLLAFVPDDAAGRLAVATALIAGNNYAALAQLAFQDESAGPPILQLVPPNCEDVSTLQADYLLVFDTLKKLADGQAVAINTN